MIHGWRTPQPHCREGRVEWGYRDGGNSGDTNSHKDQFVIYKRLQLESVLSLSHQADLS